MRAGLWHPLLVYFLRAFILWVNRTNVFLLSCYGDPPNSYDALITALTYAFRLVKTTDPNSSSVCSVGFVSSICGKKHVNFKREETTTETTHMWSSRVKSEKHSCPIHFEHCWDFVLEGKNSIFAVPFWHSFRVCISLSTCNFLVAFAFWRIRVDGCFAFDSVEYVRGQKRKQENKY